MATTDGPLGTGSSRKQRQLLFVAVGVLLLAAGLAAVRSDGEETEPMVGVSDVARPPSSSAAQPLPITEDAADAAAATTERVSEASTTRAGAAVNAEAGASDTSAGPSTQDPLARPPAGPGAHGLTDTTIEIGMITTDAAAINAVGAAASGNPDASYINGDPDKTNAAIVDHVNATGGIAGREVVPVYYKVNAHNLTTESGLQQEAQAACSKWTEDHHVFAMPGMGGSIIAECAKKTGTPVVSGFINAFVSQSQFESMSDYWYEPARFIADRREGSMARFLLDHEFFDETAKVGLMTRGTPEIIEGVDRGLKPTLAAAGIKPVIEIEYPEPLNSPWDNYVLQMQSAGVTHIIFSATNGTFFPSLFMMRAAENQQYRPKWAISSEHQPFGLIGANASPNQLENLLVMGYWPIADTGDTAPQGAAGQRCSDVLVEASQPPNAVACDYLFFLQFAMARATEASPAGLARAVEGLAGSYASGWTIGEATRFGAGRHDGATIGRAATYDRGSNTLQYTTPPEPLPN